MNTVKELKEAQENQAFEKAIQKVTSALENEPLGLQISQIMTICQLSNKTVHKVLDEIEAYQDNGTWYLSKDKYSSKPASSIRESVINYLSNQRDGASASEIMLDLNINRNQFDNAIYQIKKELDVFVNNSKAGKIYSLFEITNSESNTENELIQTDSKPSCDFNKFSYIPENEKNPIDLNSQELLEQQITTRITHKRELKIQKEQLNDLLSYLFDLDVVEWLVENDGNFLAVHMAKEVVQ